MIKWESGVHYHPRHLERPLKARGVRPQGTDTLPAKPKWMQWKTYWRHVDACRRAEQKTLEFLVASAEKILSGIMSGHETT